MVRKGIPLYAEFNSNDSSVVLCCLNAVADNGSSVAAAVVGRSYLVDVSPFKNNEIAEPLGMVKYPGVLFVRSYVRKANKFPINYKIWQ